MIVRLMLFLFLFLTVLLKIVLAGPCEPGCTPPFQDVPCDHGACTEVRWAKNRGLFGNIGPLLNPSECVTREFFATVIMRYIYGSSASCSPNPYFTDVTPSTTSYETFCLIQALKDYLSSRGYSFVGNQFCPSSIVYRPDAAVFFIRILKGLGDNFSYNPDPYFYDVPPSDPHFKYIQKSFEERIICGYQGYFNVQGCLNRAGLAVIMCRTFEPSACPFDIYEPQICAYPK